MKFFTVEIDIIEEVFCQSFFSSEMLYPKKCVVQTLFSKDSSHYITERSLSGLKQNSFGTSEATFDKLHLIDPFKDDEPTINLSVSCC